VWRRRCGITWAIWKYFPECRAPERFSTPLVCKHPKEIAKIANHAKDRFLIIDDVLLPVYEKFRKDVNFEKVIAVPYRLHAVPKGYLNSEEGVATGTMDFQYPKIEETDGAAMCFTSGTTGFSKGVIYTHRSLALHSMAEAMVDTFAVSHQGYCWRSRRCFMRTRGECRIGR
jgi:acyl-CoA synthetase (AMP-forming)/AMP-acid ligase II